jgi:hypothetical protein
VPLDELADAAIAGRIKNVILVAGALAALAARTKNWSALRSAEPLNT